MILFRCVWVLLIFSISVSCPKLAWAEASPLKSATLKRVGFQGRFKVGQWTPLTVAVETTAACQLELTVETSDPEGNRAVWPDGFEVSSAGFHSHTMLFRPGRLETVLRPRVSVKSSEGKEAFTIPVAAGDAPDAQLRQTALTQSMLLVGTLGKPGGLIEEQIATGDANASDVKESQISIRVAALSDPSELTITNGRGQDAAFLNATGLEAFDTLVISGQYEMGEEQSEALKAWVTMGGHLVVAVGEELESYQNSLLAQWLSDESAGENQLFSIAGTTSFRSLSALEHFAGKNAVPIPISPQNPVKGVRIEPQKHADSPLSVLSGPLIVRGAYGFGTVTFIGLSLNAEPVKSWPSLPSAMRKLLWDAKTAAASTRVKSQNNRLAYSGISEFATQLHAALQSFRPVSRLSTWTVIGFLAVYLIVIGPLDYFLVHQVFKRPGLTWLTFPVLVGIAAVIGVGLSRANNGEELLTSQVNVLDYDASTKLLRARTWTSIYSPESKRYHITLEPESLGKSASFDANGPAVRMSWFGIPETTFGGMYREGGQSLSPPIYRLTPQAKGIENLPIPIWGAKSLTGEWCSQGEGWVESRLESPRQGQLRGTIRHHFPVPITDWFLAYKTRVFFPRANLATGQVVPFPPESDWPRNDLNWDRIQQREIGSYLTRTIASQSQQGGENANANRMQQVPYDPLAENHLDAFGEIVRTLTFHQMVGGAQYTGMENHALRDLELSGRLGLHRAVLYGRLDLSPSKLRIDAHEPAENRTATFIRIVLPVEIKHAEDEPPLRLKEEELQSDE